MTLSFKSLLLCSALVLAGTQAFAAGTLNRGNTGDPESLDPHKTSTVQEANILRDLFEGLVAHDANANIMPGAAESWTVSEDGKVYTFKLRADGKWSDGTPVTADDFVFSLRRVVSPETAAEYAYMLAPIVNAEAITAGEKKPEELGVKAIDATTLEVTLNAVTPYFLEMLTHQATYAVSKANVEKFGADFTKPGNLVSNGAFTLTSFVPNDKIVLTKNPLFHDAANVSLDAINYIPTEDRSAAIKRFEAGELDMNDDFPTEQLTDMKAKFGDQVKIGPYLGTYYYAFKTDKAPWDNVELRNAISMAIDRDYLAEEVWQNTMLPGYSFVPPGIDGFTAQAPEWAALPQIDREDKAAEVLAKLGYGPDNPLKMEIRFNTSENHNNTAVAIQEQLKPLGIEVSLLNTDASTHYAYLEQHGDMDIARAGWIADYKDPENFLALCKTGAGNNYAVYSNAEYDALLAEAAGTADQAARFRLLEQAEAIGVARDQCIVPLMFYSFHSIVSDKVKGWEPNVMDIHPTRFMSKD
ncbi:peptide ABC transporter substrate-binding protein [Neotabrizicola shimadae]|uniref:Peptide ABC transporter substrate-binding protein n=1 Tax=Neotabrizicola shimadae TaxID=2807096 RepID=A0A8G1ECU1_9RHOB|nr:peptide ABC transporter substrate-binding protein [Neotabrizicola shimadae]QYZ70812.1 peptide ABC transporter substrate-binding protein [Neotabrizicola shimadae]